MVTLELPLTKSFLGPLHLSENPEVFLHSGCFWLTAGERGSIVQLLHPRVQALLSLPF